VIEAGDLLLKGAKLGDAAMPAADGRTPPAAAEEAGAVTPAPAAPPPPPSPVAADALPSNLPDYLNQVERDIILRALNQTQFNRTQAASLLGISVRQLRYQMQKLDIQAPEP
jgi:two-component system response regulator PilR (NtrC family)